MTGPANLSDAELCEAVAREVLKYEVETVDSLGRPWTKDHGIFTMNWSGIGQVVEAMQERDFRYELCGPNHKGNRVAWFIHPGSWGFEHFPSNRTGVEHENPARAVFEAALKAVRATDGDDR